MTDYRLFPADRYLERQQNTLKKEKPMDTIYYPVIPMNYSFGAYIPDIEPKLKEE